MDASPPAEVTLMGIPGIDRRPQNPGMAATAKALYSTPVAICREVNI